MSAAGDVLVCRSREFAQLMASSNVLSQQQNASIHQSASGGEDMKWCDIECSEFPMSLEKSSLCNPWLTTAISNSSTATATQREEKKEDDRTTGNNNRQFSAISKKGFRGGGGVGSGASTYEWGDNNNSRSNRMDEATQGLNQLELELSNSASNVGSPASSRDAQLTDDEEEMDEDQVLSMPSFDYSHFGNGGNDMLPTSPVRNRLRKNVDSASDIGDGGNASLSLKLPQQNGSRGKQPMRSQSSDFQPSRAVAKNSTVSSPDLSSAPFFHGVPKFLTTLSQVRIQQVSAHPRGSHVLMISAEALLFSYGLNDHGQLGIGVKSAPPRKGAGSHRRYVWTPTIITPLLENGGKAITCAAGESHSLVVVSTEGKRILKSRSPRNDGNQEESLVSGNPAAIIEMNRVSSSPATMDTRSDRHGDESEHSSTASSSAAAESVWHHQLYGFGRNNFMKIGLVHPKRKSSPDPSRTPKSKQMPRDSRHSHQGSDETQHDEMEDILLPHRVALHCTVWPEKTSSRGDDSSAGGSVALRGASGLPPQGIFALSASSEHSAALVRRATGDVELFTWGNSAYHALGVHPKQGSQNTLAKIIPVPTLVAGLSYSTKSSSVASKQKSYLLEQNPPEFPVDVSLGPYSSFVVTSKGRCLSFGISYDGMLGHGKSMTEVREPTPIHFPSTNKVGSNRVVITAISAGTGHVMALANSGTVYTWGKNTDGRLGLGDIPMEAAEDGVSDLERAIEWTPVAVPPLPRILVPSRKAPAPSARDQTIGGAAASTVESEYGPIVQVCAGLDCSIFVTACGKSLSCGKGSGRLGLGEVSSDVNTPTPLFGGLSLWHRPAPTRLPRRNSASPSPARNRPLLKRGMTTG